MHYRVFKLLLAPAYRKVFGQSFYYLEDCTALVHNFRGEKLQLNVFAYFASFSALVVSPFTIPEAPPVALESAAAIADSESASCRIKT